MLQPKINGFVCRNGYHTFVKTPHPFGSAVVLVTRELSRVESPAGWQGVPEAPRWWGSRSLNHPPILGPRHRVDTKQALRERDPLTIFTSVEIEELRKKSERETRFSFIFGAHMCYTTW